MCRVNMQPCMEYGRDILDDLPAEYPKLKSNSQNDGTTHFELDHLALHYDFVISHFHECTAFAHCHVNGVISF